jgi:DNA polymerase elongation subunit (family B)
MVRRDWSEISKKCSEYALDCILSGKPKEEIIELIGEYLSELNNQI